MGSETKQLYIVLSQTGTMLSRILKLITGAEYNHASISLSADLEQMYSFGRRHPYNPFWGGFVQESPHTGTFKRFQNTKVVVLAVETSEERYTEIRKILNEMYLQKENYHYNYLGLFLAAVHKEFELPASDRNPLRKKVICGTCGYAMSLSNTKNAKYHCRTSHLETQFDCTSEGILQADINEMVVTLIRTYATYAVSLEHLLLLQKERIQAEKKQAHRELAVLQSRKNQFEKSLQDLYEKLIDGSIDKETYLSQKASNQRQMQELTEQMARLEQTSQTTTEQGGAFIEKYREYTELETLTTEIANDVVKRVVIHKDSGIEIELALRDELENLLTCLEAVNAAS